MIDLVFMKKSRKKLNDGDVFVMQVYEGHYMFGKVIRAELKSPYGGFSGLVVVHIYRGLTLKPEKKRVLKEKDRILPPKIINRLGWSGGYYLTVDNQEVTDEDVPPGNYGFLKEFMVKNPYLDLDGNVFYEKPLIVGNYSLGNYLTIEESLKELLVKNPEYFEIID